MTERKIYSLNKIAWLISTMGTNNIELNLDNNNKVYATVKDEVSGLLEDYNNNVELQKFLHSYKEIRKFINKNKNNN